MSLPYDPSTQANWREVATENVDFDWTVDFIQQTISGSATHRLRVRKDNIQHVM